MPTNATQLFLDPVTLVPGATELELVQWNTQEVVTLTRVEADGIKTAAERFTIGGTLDANAPYYVRERGTEGPATALFTTAAAADTTAPAAPTVANLALTRTLYDPSDCGFTELSGVAGTVTAPDAVVLGVRLTIAGGAVTTYYLPANSDPFAFLGGCDSLVDLPAEADVAVAIWAEDAAGNTSTEVTAQARVAEIDMRTSDDGGCSTGGGGAGIALGLLALRRRRRC